MAFQTVNVSHPTIRNERSGAVTAGATAVQLSSTQAYCANGIWVKNEDSAESIRIIAPGYATGFQLSANTSRFLPVDDASKVWVQRGGSSDVAVSWYAA